MSLIDVPQALMLSLLRSLPCGRTRLTYRLYHCYVPIYQHSPKTPFSMVLSGKKEFS